MNAEMLKRKHVNLFPFREGINWHWLREVPGGTVTEHAGLLFNWIQNGVLANSGKDNVVNNPVAV